MSTTVAEPALTPVLVSLFKGVVYRDTAEQIWASLIPLRAQVSDYVSVLGLQVILDEAEGYAFLRSRPELDGIEVPRLVPRRSLTFQVSLLLALLRKKLAELDAAGTDTRLILTRDQIVEMVRVFLPDTSNETRLIAGIEANLNKIIEYGFVRRLRGTDDRFEVRRIIKAFVDGQWLGDFESRLAQYRAQLAGDPAGEEG